MLDLGSGVLPDFADVVCAHDRRAPAALRITDAIFHLKSVETVGRTTASDVIGEGDSGGPAVFLGGEVPVQLVVVHVLIAMAIRSCSPNQIECVGDATLRCTVHNPAGTICCQAAE